MERATLSASQQTLSHQLTKLSLPVTPTLATNSSRLRATIHRLTNDNQNKPMKQQHFGGSQSNGQPFSELNMTSSSHSTSGDMLPATTERQEQNQNQTEACRPSSRRRPTRPLSHLIDGLLLLTVGALVVPSCSWAGSHEPKQQQQQPQLNGSSSSEQQVDDILKDTFQLLDALDDKLASVKNSTHLAMMSEPQPAARLLDAEPSFEEALAKMTDSFSSNRRPADEVLRPAASEPSLSQANRHRDALDSLEPIGQGAKRARQLSTGQQQSEHHNNNHNYEQQQQQQQQLANDNSDRHIKFTLDLMQSIFASQSYTAETQLIESFLISPLSIQTVLMMMHLGARGQTRREIGQCLHLTSNEPEPQQSHSKRLKQRQSSAVSKQQSAASQRHQASSSQGASPNATAGAAAAAAASQPQGQLAGHGSNPHELFGAAMRNLLKDPIVTKSLRSANQIFLQKNLPLSAQYESAIRQFYAADVKPVDFQHQSSLSSPSANSPNHVTSSPDKTADSSPANNVQLMINDWIERQTNGRITNLLSSPIATSTLMMAINVLYFKGDWQYKFDPADTEPDAWFTQANGKTVRMPMMVNRLPLAFAHDPVMRTSVIELPYKAQRLGLFLLLPDEVSGIFRTMQMLNASSFTNLISSMRKPAPSADQAANGINVRIPKFGIESSPRLSQLLSQRMGLKSLFMPDMADLSAMFNNNTPQLVKRTTAAMTGNSSSSSDQAPIPQQVALDELLHKAVLQVDEQGSVAAASSATIVERVGLFNSNYFEADHPFLLFLMDKKTGLVLFSGVFAGNNNESGPQEQARQPAPTNS